MKYLILIPAFVFFTVLFSLGVYAHEDYYCFAKIGNLETIKSHIDSVSKNLICENGKCTCYLSSGEGYCQVCTDSSGYLASYDYCGSNFCEDDPNSSLDLTLSAILPFSGNFYTKQKFFINIKTNRLAKIDLTDNGVKKNICMHCSSYNKITSFSEGSHDVLIGAFVAGQLQEKTFSFFIDTKKPKIRRVLPKYDSKVVNSENVLFSVFYDEENLNNIELYYGFKNDMRKAELNGCENGANKQCSIEIDLSEFSPRDKIYYRFNVTDIVGNSAVSSLFYFKIK